MINVQVIPHDAQRYPTVGDWEFGINSQIEINVSDTGDEDSNFLIAIHEIIEAYLCKKAGISSQIVDEWDKAHLESSDPGNLRECPYRTQHRRAEYIERETSRAIEANWDEYEKRINKLFEREL